MQCQLIDRAKNALDGAQAQLSSDNQGEQDLFIEIKGMSCAACASAVQRAILNVEGVIQSEVNSLRKARGWRVGLIREQ